MVKNGKVIPMTRIMVLSDGSRVELDGSVIAKNGSRTKLKDCGAVEMNGRRIEDSSSKILVIDGRVLVMKGGITRRLEMALNLDKGRTIDQEGVLTDRNGNFTEMPEGAIIVVSGSPRGGNQAMADVKRNAVAIR